MPSRRQTWILIPHHEGRRWLPACLATLRETTPAETRVLLIDNGSTDGSLDWLRREYPAVSWLALGRNLGFVHAVNLGAFQAMAHGATELLLLNNDTRCLDRGWFDALQYALEANPDLGIVSPWQEDFAGRPSKKSLQLARPWMPSDGRSAPVADAEIRRETLPGLVSANWVEGACMLIRREVFEQIGYLDPLFAPGYYEEVDFCRRARRAGYRVALVPGAVVQHYGAGTFGAGDRRRVTRILAERNYLLYHAAQPAGGLIHAWGRLFGRLVHHSCRDLCHGALSSSELLQALCGWVRLFPALSAKILRDQVGIPCPILGTRLPFSPELQTVAVLLAAWNRSETAPQELAKLTALSFAGGAT